jgi:Flp pilus assembly pilin Flp
MLTQLRKWINGLHENTDGAMSVEKILIIALIALPILIFLVLFRNNVEGWFNTQSTDLTNAGANGTTPANGTP